MAKVTGPLMSLDASGTVGKTATFSKWKGRNVVRLRVTPLNPRTNLMQVVRQKMGSIGYMNSFVLTPVVDAPGSALYLAAKAAAPAGQSWISYLSSQIAGASFSNWDTQAAAFAALDSGVKTDFEDQAALSGVGDFAIANPPTSPASITGGELIYHLAVEAIVDLGYTDFDGGIAAATPEELALFMGYATQN